MNQGAVPTRQPAMGIVRMAGLALSAAGIGALILPLAPTGLDDLADALFLVLMIGGMVLVVPSMATGLESALSAGARPVRGSKQLRFAVQLIAVAIGLGIARSGAADQQATVIAAVGLGLLVAVWLATVIGRLERPRP